MRKCLSVALSSEKEQQMMSVGPNLLMDMSLFRFPVQHTMLHSNTDFGDLHFPVDNKRSKVDFNAALFFFT